jgi:glutamine synthetase
MLETELELRKLGVPVKTRHNEVAPGQYEIAPIFENSNVGSDHQQLMMQMMRNVARKYGLVCRCTKSPSPASTDRASTTTGRWAPTPATT